MVVSNLTVCSFLGSRVIVSVMCKSLCNSLHAATGNWGHVGTATGSQRCFHTYHFIKFEQLEYDHFLFELESSGTHLALPHHSPMRQTDETLV